MQELCYLTIYLTLINPILLLKYLSKILCNKSDLRPLSKDIDNSSMHRSLALDLIIFKELKFEVIVSIAHFDLETAILGFLDVYSIADYFLVAVNREEQRPHFASDGQNYSEFQVDNEANIFAWLAGIVKFVEIKYIQKKELNNIAWHIDNNLSSTFCLYFSLFITVYSSMQQQLKKELQILKQYAKKLESDFKNNLRVIEERQQEIEELAVQLQKLQMENKSMHQHVREIQDQHQHQINNLENHCNQKMREKQQQIEEVAVLLENKLRKQIEAVSNKLSAEVKKQKSQLNVKDQAYKKLSSQNVKLTDSIKDQKIQILDYESQLDFLLQQKNSYASKLSLHFQELQAVKNSQQGWQQALKEKIKELQSQKQKVDQQLSDVKLAYKQKLKRQKQEFSKKLLELAGQKEKQVRELALQHKEMKYKLDKVVLENKDYQKQVQGLRAERTKTEALLTRHKQNQFKSNFQKNQKQFQMMQRMFDQNARDLKSQIQLLSQEKKAIKQELDNANSKRESVEKAVERLRVQQINKTKEVNQLQKQNRRLKHEMEVRLKEAQMGQTNYKGQPNYNLNSRAFDMIQSAKVQKDVSKVFTEDMGIITDQFFEQSPKNAKNQTKHQKINRQAQLLKKIGELQVQIQQYKHLIKKLKDEAENLKKYCEDEKNRQISLYRDKANIYWEKANDKEQQVASIREQYNELKTNYADVNAHLKQFLAIQHQNKEKDSQLLKLREQNELLENKNAELLQQIQALEDQRKMLEDISAELRTEVHTLKQMFGSNMQFQEPISKLQSNYKQAEHSQYQQQQYKETVPSRQQGRAQVESVRQKIPKKLHDLVREKKAFSITGKRAALQERNAEVRLQHIGTQSQKEIYQKIKIKSKTPPKVTNYAQLKQKDKQRRTSMLQTPSQKQVLERLKSKNILSPQKLNQRGVNYLQLRYQLRNQ